MTAFNKYHPFDFSKQSVVDGMIFAVAAVCVVQIAERAVRDSRKYFLLAVGSAMLFYVIAWTPVFDNSDGRYDARIAMLIWGAITAAGAGLTYVYDRTDPTRK